MKNRLLHINSARLQQFIDQFAAIGKTERHGVTRLALTDEDKQARDLFVSLCQSIGCLIRIDPIGNIFARYQHKETDQSLPAVLIGSHGDSQPQGGRYDGIYGVLAGLEVLYTLAENQIYTMRPIELVMWTNEEGARFAPAMIGSAVFSGVSLLKKAYECTDLQGKTQQEELQRIGYLGSDNILAESIYAALELHIEQGPILEKNQASIGIVTGTLGQAWYEVSFTGQASHAGTTPMNCRQDALLGLSQAVLEINRLMRDDSEGRSTVGMIDIVPNSRNVIAGHAWFSVEFRHPKQCVLDQMDQNLHRIIGDIATSFDLTYQIKPVLSLSPVYFSEHTIDVIRDTAEKLGYPNQDIVSGAGHDACNLNNIVPTGMIFIPCIDGLSHNEAENITREWQDAGANVLLHSTLALCSE